MPKIGQEMKVTLKIWKEKDGFFSNDRIYATIVEKEQSEAIKKLLKKHTGLNEHHLDISL